MSTKPMPLKGVETACLAGGQVRVLAGSAGPDLHLRIGSRTVPFARADVQGLGSEFPFQAGFYPAAISAPEGVDLGRTDTVGLAVNALEDWMVGGSHTAQIRIAKGHVPPEFLLGEPVEVPAGTRKLIFRVHLAAHRCEALLRLTLSDVAGGPKEVHPVSFDSRTKGGRSLLGYLAAEVTIAGAVAPRMAQLSIQFLAHVGAQPDSAFLFVTDPRISDLESGAGLIEPVLFDGTRVPGAQWYEARLAQDDLSPGVPVLLASGGQNVEVFRAQSGRITLQSDLGHSLLLTSDGPRRCLVYVNGEPGFGIVLGAGSTAVRLPAALMTGQTYLLSIRDLTGSQVFCETYIAPPRRMTPSDAVRRNSPPPYPADLSHQSRFRYDALRRAVAAGGTPQEFAQLSHALSVLEAGYDWVKPGKLTFPVVDAPLVSVIIPAHNKLEVTYSCLCALLLARNRASFEVIVVDDASTDATAQLEDLVSGITVVRNAEPQRFIRACNAGAARARGTYIALLNNDTEPTVGWLDALIDAFGRFPNVGLVGAKLLYPDGKLQDAGGIVWNSGNPWNYGRGQNPWDPRFCYARQVDYVSGAAMMTTRAIWQQLDGLSSYLEPMYFEDTDFAFKVRAAGYATWFVPASIVYHHEGMTSGTDTSAGFKRFQEVNRPKFKRRWASAFAGAGTQGVAPDLEKDRGIVGRVLFIDYTTPRPDQDAGGYAAVQEMRLVQSLGYKVTFLPENLAHFGSYHDTLEKMGVEVIVAPYYISVQDFLSARGSEFDAFYLTRYYVAINTVAQIRASNPTAPILLNNADLHFLRQLRAGLADGDAARLGDLDQVQEQELAAMRSVDLVLSYNEVEHAVIQSHSRGAIKVAKCPWVVEVPDVVPPRDGRQGLSFLGGFRHHPNVDGIEWFARYVMQGLRMQRPDITLSIYGSGISARIEALATANVLPVGFIETVERAYDHHRVFVAPLLSGAGIKGKVLSALAHGIPCVLSPIAAEGVGLRHRHDCLIARTPQEWRTAVVALHDDADLWQKLSANGRAYVRESFSFAHGREAMRAAFEAVDLFRSVE